ncbi:unnamed protein product, partial [Protopolystoma xenopodis]
TSTNLSQLGESICLKELIELGLESHLEELEVISSHARQEHILETALVKMRTEWQGILLPLIIYTSPHSLPWMQLNRPTEPVIREKGPNLNYTQDEPDFAGPPDQQEVVRFLLASLEEHTIIHNDQDEETLHEIRLETEGKNEGDSSTRENLAAINEMKANQVYILDSVDDILIDTSDTVKCSCVDVKEMSKNEVDNLLKGGSQISYCDPEREKGFHQVV